MDKQLTSLNFVQKIKQMTVRERGKLQAAELVELILNLPDQNDDRLSVMAASIEMIQESLKLVTQTTASNSAEIQRLSTENVELRKENEALRNVNLDATNTNLVTEFNELREQVQQIEQYLRINNLEIVGLPDCNENESDETLIINALNSLEGLENPIRHEDVDISHPLKSKRKDNKPVHVVRFISRKTKFSVLAAKKLEANRLFKFRNKDVFINEHLSPTNRELFADAAVKKSNLNYKFLWTKNGTVHLRKNENCPVAIIKRKEDLEKLA